LLLPWAIFLLEDQLDLFSTCFNGEKELAVAAVICFIGRSLLTEDSTILNANSACCCYRDRVATGIRLLVYVVGSTNLLALIFDARESAYEFCFYLLGCLLEIKFRLN